MKKPASTATTPQSCEILIIPLATKSATPEVVRASAIPKALAIISNTRPSIAFLASSGVMVLVKIKAMVAIPAAVTIGNHCMTIVSTMAMSTPPAKNPCHRGLDGTLSASEIR